MIIIDFPHPVAIIGDGLQKVKVVIQERC